MFRKQIHTLLATAADSLGVPPDSVHIDVPTDVAFGDYSTNIALLQAKKLGTNPMDLAHKVISAIPPNDIIEKAQGVKPGFVNIFLKQEVLLRAVRSPAKRDPRICTPTVSTTLSGQSQINKGLPRPRPEDSERTPRNDVIVGIDLTTDLTGKSITVEFTDPNPFKEFHIGHLYSNTAGESISRLLEAVGAKVRRVNYQGDVGIHVACSVWGMLNKTLNSKLETLNAEEDTKNNFLEIGKLPLSERVKWMGQCYALGATAYKEDESVKKDIQALNAQIFLAAQTMWRRESPNFTTHIDFAKLITREVYPQDVVQEYYEKGRQWTLDYFEKIYQRLGTHYQAAGDYYFESFIGELGYQLVSSHIDDGIFERSDGAVVFKGEKYGLHTRVFINSLGLPTYEAKEMGLNPTKYADHPFDISLIITADEIEEYFKVVLKALSLVAPDVAARTKHLPHGVVKLPEGKMSSRTGQIVSGETLLDEVRDRLHTKVAESKRLESHDLDATVERLAVAAVKYSFLRSNLGKDVVFNFEESLSFEGNSGPYLLYTIVRCRSILTKAGIQNTDTQLNLEFRISDLEFDMDILRLLIHFPDVVASAAEQYAPHMVCTYLHKLAQEFNAYYDKAPILKAEGDLRTLRLLIVQSVADTLTRGSHILGFETVERM